MFDRAPLLGQVPLRGSIPAARPYRPARRVLGQNLPATYARFEIKDQGGNFISGATVAITTDDGRALLSKQSDTGGNVAISPQEIQDAATAAGIQLTKLNFTVSAPGKASETGVFLDPSVPPELKIHEITLKAGGVPTNLLAPIAIVGLVGVGLVVLLS